MAKWIVFFGMSVICQSVQAVELASVKDQLRVELWQEGLVKSEAHKTEKKSPKAQGPRLNEELIRAIVKYQL